MSDPADFFFAGGTLRPQARSYVVRPADHELLASVRAGEFCYVLTSRQMGKSSLMVRTARRLADEQIKSVIIDLTSIGTVSIDEWYLGLLARIRAGLRLSAEIEAWWGEHAGLSVPQRFGEFLRDVVLAEVREPVAIFIDEIDTTLNLGFRDDFFAAIRAIYNARAAEPVFNRLTFVLLGVATPTDLIQDRDRTPFNIGRRIVLRELSYADAAPLRDGLEQQHPAQGEPILARIFHWTGGHPYLTQKLCIAASQAPAAAWGDPQVDALVEATFFSEEARKDSNLTFVNDRIQAAPHAERRSLLRLYRRVYTGERVSDDDRSPTQNHLELFGLIRVEQGALAIRNEIYRRVFGTGWIAANMPSNRQRFAAIGAALAAILTVALALVIFQSRARSQQAITADAAIRSFESNASPAVRMQALASLLSAPPYDQKARELFFRLALDEQRALFQQADPATQANDIQIVVDGIYPYMNSAGELSRGDPEVMGDMSRALAKVQAATPAPASPTIQTLQLWLNGRHTADDCAPGNPTACQSAVDKYTRALAAGQAGAVPALHYDRALALVAAQQFDQALDDLDAVVQAAEQAQAAPPAGLSQPAPPRFINADSTVAIVTTLLASDARLLEALQRQQDGHQALAKAAQASLAALAQAQTATALAQAQQTQAALAAAQATTSAVGSIARATELGRTAQARQTAAQIAAAQTAALTPSPTRARRPTATITAQRDPTAGQAIVAAGDQSATEFAQATATAIAQATASALALPARLVFTSQPSQVVAGAALTSIGVEIQNSAGARLALDSPITIVLEGGAGTQLLGSRQQPAAGGLATFSNLSIRRAGTGYRLRASASNIPDALSQPFAVVAGPAARLAFADQPSQTEIYLSEPPASVVVEVLDAYGNLVTDYDQTLSGGNYGLGLTGRCGQGWLNGAAAGIQGKPSDGRLTLDSPGGSMHYSLSSPNLASIERSYYIFGAPTLRLTLTPPGAGNSSGWAQVDLVDSRGRQVLNYDQPIAVTLSASGQPDVTLQSDANPRAQDGSVCYPLPSLAAGTYTVRATSASLTSNAVEYTVQPDALSATVFVGPAGSDAASCATAAASCRTLAAAIGRVSADGTVVIAGGTYLENIVITKNLTLQGAGRSTTIIDGSQAGSVVTIASGATVSITGLTIQNGSQADGNGGGIASAGSLTLSDATISNNYALVGGGIYNTGRLTVQNVTVANNTTLTTGCTTSEDIRNGGGIYNQAGGATTIRDSSILANTACFGGGLYNNVNGTLTVSRSVVANNTALAFGGGLLNWGSAAIANATFTGNASIAIWSGGSATILNSTVAGNAGGISGNATIGNSIIAGNTAAGSNIAGGITSLGHNLIGDPSGASGFVDTDLLGADPNLGPLQDNGGPTPTMAPQAGSPAIDAGDGAICADPAVGGKDQRGTARPQGAACDIGAHEA